MSFLKPLIAPKTPEPSYPSLPWVAESGESSIQCGICVDVCPMNVLSFGLKGTKLPIAKASH